MDRAACAPDPRAAWTVATDALARHKRHPKVNRCDECVRRWPCDTFDLADSHETLLAACIAGLALIGPGSYDAPAAVQMREAIAKAYGESP